jgi:hypothetical protein
MPDRAEQEMKPIAFYGASDDLIEVEGSFPGCDEYNAEDGLFQIAGLLVSMAYGERGCWVIGTSKISENVPVLATNLRLSAPDRDNGEPGYTMRLDMEVPAGSYVTKVDA